MSPDHVENFVLIKRQIEAQISELERHNAEFAAFMEGWRRRNPPREQSTGEAHGKL